MITSVRSSVLHFQVLAWLFAGGLNSNLNQPGLPFYVASLVVVAAAIVARVAFNSDDPRILRATLAVELCTFEPEAAKAALGYAAADVDSRTPLKVQTNHTR